MALPTSIRIDQAVRDYFIAEVNSLILHAEEGPRDGAFEMEQEIADANQFLSELRVRIGVRKYTPTDIGEAQRLLEKSDLELPPKTSDLFDDVCNKALRARAEAVRIFLALLQGRHDEAQPRDPLFTGNAAQSQTINNQWSKQKKTLTQLSEAYIEQHKKSWAAKTVIDKVRVNGWFVDLAGASTPITDVTADVVREFRSLLLKLPANLAKHKAFHGVPLPEAIQAAQKQGLPSLSLRTADKYLGMLNAFLQWCVDEGFIPANPVGKISVPFKRASAAGAVESYKIEQLNRLFSSPLYAGHQSKSRRHISGPIHTRDGKYWVPLIALFSGMRAGEIIQLQLQDIRNVDDVWVFDVNKGEGDKSVKTASSIRQIPIHPMLEQLGFLVFVDAHRAKHAGSHRLFAEITLGKQGDPSHAYSKYFGRYTKLVGVKGARTNFHSFRHTFVDALRRIAVAEYVLESLTGHSSGKVSSGYGSAGVPIKLKAAAIAAVGYPGLDLAAHLTVKTAPN